MGLLEKVRDFFYDEEDEEELEIKPKKHKEKRIKVKETKEIDEVVENEETDKISERELFKAERTFNFPMDLDEDFNQVKYEEPKEIEIEEKPIEKVIYEEKKEPTYYGIRNYARYEQKKEEKKEEKKFKPTPVISPIYGILDKNYKKEDLIIDDTTKKVEDIRKVDYDSVRKKAYAKVYEKEEKEDKSIFYNLDEEPIIEEKENNEEDDVKIVYNDVTFEDDYLKDDENVTIGQKIEEYEMNNNEEENNILSETKEQDLFNLIDNMYNSEEEYEGDEE